MRLQKFGYACRVWIFCGDSEVPIISGTISWYHQGVNEALEVRGNADQDPLDLIGAGDQGLMFGFAVDETEELHAIANFTQPQTGSSFGRTDLVKLICSVRCQITSHCWVWWKWPTRCAWIQWLFQLNMIQKSACEQIHEDVINKVIKVISSILSWWDKILLINRSFRYRWTSRWLWFDWSQDYRRYLWWLLTSQWWCLLW